jgi:phospholipid/cholesterol/gamma-HCH transport system permease protein
VGARSAGVVALSAVFTGLVLALQGYNVLVRFGSENLVGSLVALSLTRELAPVLTALMVTARAGSAMAATIGNMAVTEQIDALKSLAIDPIQYLAVPRLIASVIALPLLTASFSLAGIAAAYLFGVSVLGLDGLAFMSNVRSSVEWSDVSIGLWKAMIFGALIAWISTFQGFRTTGGARGVGRSTSRTVVECAVLILCGDYVVTALLS